MNMNIYKKKYLKYKKKYLKLKYGGSDQDENVPPRGRRRERDRRGRRRERDSRSLSPSSEREVSRSRSRSRDRNLERDHSPNSSRSPSPFPPLKTSEQPSLLSPTKEYNDIKTLILSLPQKYKDAIEKFNITFDTDFPKTQKDIIEHIKFIIYVNTPPEGYDEKSFQKLISSHNPNSKSPRSPSPFPPLKT